MNEHDYLIKKCELLLYSITDKEFVIPLKDFKLYTGIKHYKEECIEKILELLDKETPMKPTNQYPIDFGLGNYGDCRICNCGVNYQQNYCDNCGQKIDWSDEE